jgi:hypothetical protein
VIRPEIRQAVLANLPAGSVLLEGLEDSEDPLALLRAAHAQAQHPQLFALIANGAYLPALGAFFNGGALAAGHPLVRAEIEALLLTAGWRARTIAAIADAAIPPPQAAPLEINAGAIIFQITDSAALERVRAAAFFVVADRQ